MPRRHEVRLQQDRRRSRSRLALAGIFAILVNVGLLVGFALLLRIEQLPAVDADKPIFVFELSEEPLAEPPAPEVQAPEAIDEDALARLEAPSRPTETRRIDAPVEPPEPEPEPEPEVLKEEESKPQVPLEPVPRNMKMVEQLDQFDEEHAPTDADYLSNVNRDVDVQTRAEVTNLVKDAPRVELAESDDQPIPEKGDKGEEQLVQPGDASSTRAKTADLHEMQEEPAPGQATNKKQEPVVSTPPLLQMRAQRAQTAQEAAEAKEDLARTANDGMVAEASESRRARRAQRARRGGPRQRAGVRLLPSPAEIAAMVGGGGHGRSRAGGVKRAGRAGVWDEARKNYQSPLENMVPEVQPGNQTALRSRKHPFARYIATIHRRIHELWAYGILRRWDTLPGRSPLSDQSLWSRIEIVIEPDGTLAATNLVHFSGSSMFDGAAKEVVRAAGPFPEPPPAIRSGNGKVYMHWTFHRNQRACGTFGVMPYILDNEGEGDRPDPHLEVHLDGGGHAHHHPHGADAVRRLKRKPVASVGPGVALPPNPQAPAQARPSKTRARKRTGKQLRPRKQTPATGGGVKPKRPSEVDPANDPLVRSAALAWLRPLFAGQLKTVLVRSGLPFRSGETIIARSDDELRGVMRSFVAEAKGSKLKSARSFTAASLQRALGSVPSGVQPGPHRAYTLVKTENDRFVLILEKRFGAWRVIGLTR